MCSSTSRIYVQDSIYDEFLRRFVEITKGHDKLGNPFQQDVYQGPQISKQQYDKILSYIEEGKKAGAKLLYGGAKREEKGYFIDPTVFADVRRHFTALRLSMAY